MSDPDSVSLTTLDRIQPALLIGSIGLGLAAGSVAPRVGAALASAVSVGVFVLICLVMLGVDLRGVAAAFGNRRFLAISVAINFVVNPMLAWTLGTVFLGSEPDLFIGFVLFLVTPCIGWYLIFTELAGGDTVLGVSLLAVNVVLQILLLPVYLWLFAGRVLTVDVGTIVESVGIYLVAPLLLITGLRWMTGCAGQDVDRIRGWAAFDLLKIAVLMIVVGAMFASQADAIFTNKAAVLRLVPPTVAFFAIAFAVATTIGRATALPAAQTALLVFTTTSRNSEASLAIAVTAFASPLVALPVAIGPAIELPILVLMVRLLERAGPDRGSVSARRIRTTPRS